MKKLNLFVLFSIATFYAFAQNYTILGSASSMGGCNCYRLTPDAGNQAGAIFQNQTINLNNSFDFTFNVFLGCNGSNGADGIMFVLTSNPNGLGNPGEGLGYAGGNQPFSLAVEFDTWENGNAGDPSYDHIGIHSGGLYNHNVAGPVPALTNSGNIDNCQWYTVRIVWDVNTNTFSVYFNGVLRHSVVIPNMVATYFGGNPVVNWGWSGATGGGTNDQQVCVLNTSSWVAGVNYQSCSTTMQFSDVSTSSLGSVQSWAWNFGDGTTSNLQNPVHTYSSMGTYTVTLTITDVSGCTNTYSHPVTINPPIILTPSGVSPPCNGGLNGSLSATATGGFGVSAGYGGYQYSWNGGVYQGQTYPGVPAGTYTVTVTDGVCTTTGQYTLNQPSALLATTSHTDASCGANNGTATITITGGTPPYTPVNWGTGGIGTTVTGLSPGVYVADFRDANNCSSLLQYRETIGSLPCGYNLSTSSTNVSCFGGSNGTATLAVTGGISPINITWTGGRTGATITNLPSGNYTYNYSDGNGQTFTGTVTVNQPGAAMVASMTTINMSCANTNDGEALASVTSGGVPPYSYNWSRGTVNGALSTGLTPGAISVIVTDSRGCTATATGTITGPPVLTLNITAVDDSCYQSETGRATANVSGGNPPYLFYWSNISSAQTNLSLGAGTYTVTVTDDKGCTITGTTTINQPPAFTRTLSSQNIACFGSNTGSITVTPNGGVPGYTYTWNPSSISGGNPTGLAAGQYNLTLSDSRNCRILDSVVITQPASALSVSTSHTNVTCNGASNGTLTITISGGTLPYSYQGNPVPPGTTTLTGLPPNTYAGNVTDANNCSVAVSETITEPAVLTVTETHTNVNCFGQANGTIDVTVTGGTIPYTFVWSDGNISEDRTNLSAGCNTLTVTDNNGCSTTITVCITEPTVLTISETHTNVLCNGAATGSIDVTVAGGTTNYSYIWNDGITTTEDRTNIAAGVYSVTAYDALQCSITLSVTLSEPTLLTATTSSTNVTCNGASDGTITITVNGGTQPYSFLGNPVPVGSTTLPGLAPNTYAGNITDENGCTVAVSEIIIEPGPQSLNIISVNDASCNGGSDGAISVDFVNATGTPSYDWNPGGIQSATRSNLTAGIYSITASDQNNCTVIGSATINEPVAPTMPVTVVDATCFGGNGSATANPVTGTPPFTFTWSVPGSGQTISLPAGNYTVSAQGANGCNETAAFTVNEPADITVAETHTDIRCFGDANGTITLSPSGGTGTNYQYTWLPNVSSGATASLLVAGIYNVTVADQVGCEKTIAVTLTQPAQALSVNIQSNNVSCYGQNNGSITIIASGGTPGYTYTWTPNVSTTNTATGLSPNTYSVLVADTNNCNSNPSITITEPALPLSVTSSFTNLTCYQSADGTATVTANGGTFPYSYSWTPNVSSFNTATGLDAGNYSVLVTDLNGCSNTETYVLTEPAQLILSESHTNILCNGNATGTIDVVAGGGTPGYSFTWNPSVNATPTSATGLVAGSYNIVVMDTIACNASVTVIIIEPPALNITAVSTNVLCNGGSTGTITATVSGGTPGFNYTATDGANVFTSSTGLFTGLAAGLYTIAVADQNGCADTTTVTVNQPPVLSAIVDEFPSLCFQSNDGRLVVSGIGGVPGYSYTLSNGTSNSTGIFNNLPVGNYSVTIADASGCSITGSGIITEPDAVIVTVSPNPTEVKLGEAIQITTTTNQNGILTYDWQPNFGLNCYDCPNPVFSGVYSQPYRLVVTNSDGCTGSSGFTVTVIPNYDIFIPNVFTPNGDGQNDFWQIFGNIPAVKQLNVKVFNRIGEKVFEGLDINFKWDGTFRGEKVPPGVYVYVAKFVWLNNHSDSDYTGSITVLH